MRERIAIIGGTGLGRLDALEVERQQVVITPHGEPSAPLTYGEFDGVAVIFLPRHGEGHTIPPHLVNYRANLWALHSVGVRSVVSVASVGGITQPPETLCIPDQIIDYTWGREHTYVDCCSVPIKHVDFTKPYCQELRQRLLNAAAAAGVAIKDGGTYGATQGPRLETAAEIDRMERDGCDLVGMTGMPEAALARELDLCFAHLTLVVNWAAGRGGGPIFMDEIKQTLAASIDSVRSIISRL
ncbi:MAG TPA: S-methyl-5'-thioinosine phosphorylase [Chromatiaceae bacterium]|nr:S-methyl-5'-thioinosine phosphorylase [Chromatiaceae bacterium]